MNRVYVVRCNLLVIVIQYQVHTHIYGARSTRRTTVGTAVEKTVGTTVETTAGTAAVWNVLLMCSASEGRCSHCTGEYHKA